MPLFDRYVVVDWSANNSPKKGKDSIWIADASQDGLPTLSNPATRHEAMARVSEIIAEVLDAGKRVLIGFDFAFGYPSDAAFLPGEGRWNDVWTWLGEHVRDDEANVSNRFEIAGQLNQMCGMVGPFWGHPAQHVGRYDGLGANKPEAQLHRVREKRHVEKFATNAQSVWKLAYTGSVGSQTLLGVAALQKLRKRFAADALAIWPFETNFAENLSRPVTVAEIYPSYFSVSPRHGETMDEAQVRTLATGFAERDAAGGLGAWLDGPKDEVMRRDALEREGWIVGVGADLSADEASIVRHDYVREPAEIYHQSFATIEAEADLARFDEAERPLVVRLIHACGMVDVAADVEISATAAKAGIAALTGGAPIICDVEMVRHGIIRGQLPSDNSVECFLNDREASLAAERLGTTRSAGGMEAARDLLPGSVLAIGNAPTALFHVLEMIEQGMEPPALIIGIPVGFVGAVESKEALVANALGFNYVTVNGRRGGSAMASAVVNALAKQVAA
jgi:precorrin-8X/cobalt-precorrin-8 methylmutase